MNKCLAVIRRINHRWAIYYIHPTASESRWASTYPRRGSGTLPLLDDEFESKSGSNLDFHWYNPSWQDGDSECDTIDKIECQSKNVFRSSQCEDNQVQGAGRGRILSSRSASQRSTADKFLWTLSSAHKVRYWWPHSFIYYSSARWTHFLIGFK